MSDNNDVPECWGDPDSYDPDDSICRSCAKFKTCEIKVDRVLESKNRGRSNRNVRSYSRDAEPPRSSTRRRFSIRDNKPAYNERYEKENIDIPPSLPENNDTYGSVLIYNASIEAIQAITDEISSSVRHIPRKTYRGLWKRDKK